ncbi:MAG: type I-C CRISPR-associated protein Cas5c [Limisphaera sp.]|nr:type I-C CRISPR-associated protein Cas5c [Limisphaera sp.]
MIIHLRTWGELACFTRPEMKVERVSYPVMTPSAARGLLEAILYRPQFRWEIRRIAVKKPIRFISFRRNEVKSRLAVRNPKPINAEEDRTQRNTLALRDVEYVIEASLRLTPCAKLPRHKPPAEDEPAGEDTVVKYLAMFQRRVEKGQCFVQPCFGCREFPAYFELADESAMRVEPNPNPDADLGLMVYDVFDLDVSRDQKPGKVEAKPQVTLFRAVLKDGVLVEHGKAVLPEWSSVKAQLGGVQ